MSSNGSKAVEQLPQSHDPEIYKLPPIPDWAVQAVPGETPEEASPILYSKALADLSIRQTLIAVADTRQVAEDTQTVSYDLCLIGADELEEAMEGAEKIRADSSLPKEIRRPVVEFLKLARRNCDTEPSAEEHQLARGNGQSDEAHTKKARQAAEREQRRQSQIERQAGHDAKRQAEMGLVHEWQADQPPKGTNYTINVMPFLQTRAISDGKFKITERNGYRERLHAFVKGLAENPSGMFAELKDTASLTGFTAQQELSILPELIGYSGDETYKAWGNLAFDDPDQLSLIFGRWMSVYDGFSEEFKSGVVFKNNNMINHEAFSDPNGPMANETSVFKYGRNLLFESLIKVAEVHPEKFLDIAYGLMQDVVDSENVFARNSALFILAGVLTVSPTANMIVINTPIARGFTIEEKLKGVDLRHAMELVGCKVGGIPRDGGDSTPKKINRKYGDVIRAALELGIDAKNPDFEEQLFKLSYEPYIEMIENGELANNLCLKIKQQGGLPEDA